MKHVFIVNRISGKGLAYQNLDNIKKVCEDNHLDYVIEISDYPGHIQELVKKYNNEKNITIYSVGGDGTFLDVVNSVDPKIEVGLLPCGSGNDFYRYFGGVNTNFLPLIENTIKAKSINVDIGQTDIMKFTNTTSLGIDAKINFDASKLIRKTILTKGIAYTVSIIRNIINLKSSKVRMFVDGKDYSDDYFIISIMNGKYYGNGVLAAPDADVSDGYFDIVFFKKTGRIKAYKALIRYLSGKATEKDGVIRFRCKNVVIDSDVNLYIQSDGENYESKHLEIHMIEKYLKLKVSK